MTTNELNHAREQLAAAEAAIGEIETRIADLTSKREAAAAEHAAAVETIADANRRKVEAVRAYDSTALAQAIADLNAAEAGREAAALLTDAGAGEVAQLQRELSRGYERRNAAQHAVRTAEAHDAIKRLLAGPAAVMVRQAVETADLAGIDLADTLRAACRGMA